MKLKALAAQFLLLLIIFLPTLEVTGQISVPTELAAAKMGGDPRGGDANARFAVGLTLDNGGSYVRNARVSDPVKIIGVMHPAPEHVGLTGDIFVVDRVNGVFTMRNQEGNFLPWNTRIADLVPFLEDVKLSETFEISAYRGRLGVAGSHKIFIGYLPTGGVLHFTPFPMDIDIADTALNGACLKPEVAKRGLVGQPVTYTAHSSNTGTQVEGDLLTDTASYVRDFNGDGKDDIFWMESEFDREALQQTTFSRVWISDGDGNFSEQTSVYLPESLPADMPRQLLEADLDGDGNLDFIVLQHGFDPFGYNGLGPDDCDCTGAPNMVILLGDDGVMRDTGPAALNPYDTNGFTHAGGVADADCDGDPDILEGQLPLKLAPAPHRLQLNDGTGHFQAKHGFLPVELENEIHTIGMYGAAFCDLDNDGDADIYVAQNGILPGLEAADVILSNDGSANFHLLPGRRVPASRVGENSQRPSDLKCFDFNGDGYLDILKPNEADPSFPPFELLQNNGDMTFTDVTDEKMEQTSAVAAFRPHIKDLNSDGWPDILAKGTGDNMRIYWNNGAGFTEYHFPSAIANLTAATSPAVGDFDGDGDLDIHVNRANYGDLILFAE